ncbi:hypothetical protein TrVFT333_008290 [Trichoderma virens FT-333]|nr:hypothetical protein TrVFT333_008290 [Trichoderma virens FT-333]
MGHDLPRRPSQQGFHKTFGQGRSIKRDLIQGDSQRPSGDTASNLKRTRNIDRRDERSPVGQRDRLEGSSPTALGANRQRPPDNARPHPSSQSSKSSTSHSQKRGVQVSQKGNGKSRAKPLPPIRLCQLT